jgi:2-dehydro-3-deoxy-phosphogluconate/2-dehydro-3-deoxy-6-phosphogalactonate aldolase
MPHRIVPMVTPFRANKPDAEKLVHHARMLLRDGVDYVFLGGTTGLGVSMTVEEKLYLLEELSREYSSKLLLQVGTLDLEQSIRLAEAAKKNNLHAIVSYPPYFYPRMQDDWVVKQFVTLSKIYPMIVYNYPLATGYEISPAILKRTKQGGGNIIGIKDTLPDVGHMLSFKYELGDDFLVYSGPDTVVTAAVRGGIDGCVAGTANYCPELLIKATDLDASLSDAIAAQKTITALAGVARKYGQWAANYYLVKAIRGYDVGEPRPPIYPLGPAEQEKLAADAREAYPLMKSK